MLRYNFHCGELGALVGWDAYGSIYVREDGVVGLDAQEGVEYCYGIQRTARLRASDGSVRWVPMSAALVEAAAAADGVKPRESSGCSRAFRRPWSDSHDYLRAVGA